MAASNDLRGSPIAWRTDWATGFFVAMVAFLLASYPARNNDIWAHLAKGRMLSQGQNPLSSEIWIASEAPAASTGLFDLAIFALYAMVGGAGIVVAKALLAVALAFILLHVSQTGGNGWLPAFATVLAILAMSMRLLLYPPILSFLLLALTLKVFCDESSRRADWPSRWLPPWTLLLLFVAWVNIGSGFVIGLAVVSLLLMGRVLDLPRDAKARGAVTGAAWIAILAAACLLNPQHVHAFFLAPELGWLVTMTSAGPGAVRTSISPFSAAYLSGSGLSPAGLAYFPLLCLGLLSFLLAPRRWQWLLPWCGLALLSILNARAIPYFAVIAGPVLAWNLQAVLQRRSESALLRGMLAALGLAFLVCAWPGWLQAPPYEPRRWAIETAPALQRGALAVQRWRSEGKLGPDLRGLHVSAESAGAFAWFCPEVPGRYDERLVAALLARPDDREAAAQLRSARFDYLIVYHADRDQFATVLARVFAEPQRWPLLLFEGDLAVFGRRDPGLAPGRDWPARLDLDELAFHPEERKQAPRQPPTWAAAPRDPLDAYWLPRPARSIDLDEATFHLVHAELIRKQARTRHLFAWDLAQEAGIVGLLANPAGVAGLIDIDMRLVFREPARPKTGFGLDGLSERDRLAYALPPEFARHRDDTPPALLYLALRAARRAVAQDPYNAQAHATLGECYLRLIHETRERAWAELLPELAQLRRTQASAALNQAIALKPDILPVQLSLATLYRELGFADLELKHLQQFIELTRRAGGAAAVPREAERDPLAGYEKEAKRLAREVAQAEQAFAAAAPKLRVADRALEALKMGLGGRARKVLEESDVSAFGRDGMALQLDLFLQTGRSKAVREWTHPEQRQLLGPTTFHWLRVQALAAAGDYVRAKEECAQLGAAGHERDAAATREEIALTVAGLVLADATPASSCAGALCGTQDRLKAGERLKTLVRNVRQGASAQVLLGMLALEEGAVEDADIAFRVALSNWKDASSAANGAGLDFNGRGIAETAVRWLQR